MTFLNRRELIGTACAAAALASLPACATIPAGRRVGRIERIDPALDAIIDTNAPIEVLGEGYGWSEGPVWVERDGGFLLFSDVPGNRMWRWSGTDGVTLFMEPSGLQGPIPQGVREGGANGLALDAQGRLLIADSGNRAVSRYDFDTKARTVLVDRFEGKRLNSPNDVLEAPSGALYFTDPPYGLEGLHDSLLRELGIAGVYRMAPDGGLAVVDDSLTFPNGIALSPDAATLYVAVSDEAKPAIYAYDLGADGMPKDRRLFRDLKPLMGEGNPGLPDGMAVAPAGHIFATGPGGVHVLGADGRSLGLIRTGKAVANCCIGEDGRSLFMTSHDMLARVALRP